MPFTTDPPLMARTRLALLATIGDLHSAMVGYDLARLRSLVEHLEPDLLGVEGDPASWATTERSSLPLEVRGALMPAARRTDTVIVLRGSSPLELAPPEGVPLRNDLIRLAQRVSRIVERTAGSPEGVNGGLVTHICGMLCTLESWAASENGRRAWDETNQRMLLNLVAAIRRDPGLRVVAAVQCPRVHWLAGRLAAYANEIELVSYRAL